MMNPHPLPLIAWASLTLAACAENARSPALSTDEIEAEPAAFVEEAPSPPRHPVGTSRVEIRSRSGRGLPLQIWYPADEAARAEASAGHPVSAFEPPGPRRALLERLLASAPAGCPTTQMHAALDAAPAASSAPFPLLVYSHHLEGMRLALFSIAEQLASLGFVVAAPDHTDMTLYDRKDDLKSADLLGTVLRFRLDALRLRADDIESVLDVMLDSAAQAIPEALRGRIDATQVGVFGHSMGSMTAGVVAQRDRRVGAAAFISFPPARTSALLNLLDQPDIASFRVPALFMLNQEDAPLGLVGGIDAMRRQFQSHRPLSYLVELPDSGHWSFADTCALIPDFADGCGKGTRVAAPFGPYQSLDNDRARALAARYLASFFGSRLLGLPAGPLTDGTRSANEVVRSHPASDGARPAR